ncbi:hypothetical protein IX27_06335 [Streptomyces sp. JS01]|uniref:hypothetical protein n=1 Tax=unclassified Streptomyces TaxID=2593676 RepID=UPI000500B309|nr:MULTISPECIES: hypothetical protein [unclassified Streptomyces]KFK90623.1 hypothetical protein IX27_06335 [Streptomyces sp. JS01]
MRKSVLGTAGTAFGTACVTVPALGLGTAPATAARPPPPPRGSGWEPAPSAPWDVPAGERCAFAVHGVPIVDEVVSRELPPPAEGVTRTAYKGDLVIRVTNKETGAHYDADVSGTALVDAYASGAQFWRVLGPVLVGVGEGSLARGLYVVDGAYTIDIGPTGTKTVAGPAVRTDSICARIG